jgi:hypothetical protein
VEPLAPPRRWSCRRRCPARRHDRRRWGVSGSNEAAESPPVARSTRRSSGHGRPS